MKQAIMWSTVVLAAAASGCAAPAHGDRPASLDAHRDFNGAWSVDWCDRANPGLECGGFAVTLVQDGTHVCGDFTGALVNLRQIDEGTITGEVVDRVAVLSAQSGRSDTIMQVRVKRVGPDLHWKAAGQLQEGGPDIDVIALDDILKPVAERSRPRSEICKPHTP